MGNNVPFYAILSHRWGQEEVSLQDLKSGEAERKAGYDKIKNACSQAVAHGLDYIWIDTCSIDKTSSAELSEAINSMYAWYREAVVCYAYLADVSMDQDVTMDQDMTMDQNIFLSSLEYHFQRSEWFTRGWTLQELIAPSAVVFFSSDWQRLGTKSSLREEISRTTRIPTTFLLGRDLEEASIAQRMSWASQRKTTRVEDLAYCLMGIFRVNMPLIYGEGERAFIRLQNQIMNVSDDHTLFAWERLPWDSCGLLATSPQLFSTSGALQPIYPSGAITVNNKGINLLLPLLEDSDPLETRRALLPCTNNGMRVAIHLKVVPGTGEYTMTNNALSFFPTRYKVECHEEKICILHENSRRRHEEQLVKAARFGNLAVIKTLLDSGAQPDLKNSIGETALVKATQIGHEAIVKLLLKHRVDLETIDGKWAWTALAWAAKLGSETILKLLIEAGAHLESRSTDGQTPLLLAAIMGHENVVKLLVEAGANIEAEDEKQCTPLWWASSQGHEKVVTLLLEKGARAMSMSKARFRKHVRGGRIEKRVSQYTKGDYGRGLRLRAARC